MRKPRGVRMHRENWQPASALEIERPQRRIHKVVAVIAAALGIILIAYAGYLWAVKNRTEASANVLFGNLRYLLFNSSEQLSAGREEIRAAGNNTESVSTSVSPLKLLPFLREVPNSISQIGQLASALIAVDNSFALLRNEGLGLFFGGNGQELVSILKDTDAGLKQVSGLSDSIRETAEKLGTTPPNVEGSYLALGTELRRQTDMLDALIALLERPESHVLLVFEDTSVLRPGGGRITAYGDLNLGNGSFKSVEVRSVSAAEKSLGDGLVPPIPLQLQETSWKIRDANWFFDFPSSAAKVKSFIETAESDSGNTTQYTGVIAITPDVLTDIVRSLSPIQVDGLKKPITEANFVSETKRLGYERLMNMLLPAIAARIHSLSGAEKGALAGSLANWITNREARLYFMDPALQSYVLNSDWGGGVWPLPDNFSGDYLGFARADIGTKSSLQETLGLRSQIGADGSVRNDLTIVQTNNGGTISQDFMQVFVPSGSHLVQIAGNTYKKVSPPVNYKRLGYSVDSDVAVIEGTRTVDAVDYAESYQAFGRGVFGFWLSPQPRVTRTATLTYDSSRIKISDGTRYEFAVERQPGEDASLNYSVEAPPGWHWRESGKPVFYYNTDHLPGRTVINLTLEQGD